MNKENFDDVENDNEEDENVMPALLDSDIDEMENELINMDIEDGSEEYRW